MNGLDKFNDNAGTLFNFFTAKTFRYIQNICDSFEPTHVDQHIVEYPLQKKYGDKESKREFFDLGESDPLYNTIYREAEAVIQELFDGTIGRITLWRDYPYYTNGVHFDDPNLVKNIVIVYLMDDVFCGTQFHDRSNNSFKYCDAEINKGFYLLESDKTFHGTKYYVPENYIRKTLYFNFTLPGEDG